MPDSRRRSASALDHLAQRDIRVGKIPDGFNQGLRLGERRFVGFHTDQYDTDRYCVKYIIT
jgi:hypothetical protein